MFRNCSENEQAKQYWHFFPSDLNHLAAVQGISKCKCIHQQKEYSQYTAFNSVLSAPYEKEVLRGLGTAFARLTFNLGTFCHVSIQHCINVCSKIFCEIVKPGLGSVRFSKHVDCFWLCSYSLSSHVLSCT